MTRVPVGALLAMCAAVGCDKNGVNNELQGATPIDGPVGAPSPVVATPNLGAADNAASADLVIVEVLRAPTDWVGRTVSGKARVVEVPTDRGFWVESGGQRIFAILIDQPQEDPIDINVGQTLQITTATVHDASTLDQIPGEPMEEETKTLARSQPVYLVVDEDDVTIQAPQQQGQPPGPGAQPETE